MTEQKENERKKTGRSANNIEETLTQANFFIKFIKYPMSKGWKDTLLAARFLVRLAYTSTDEEYKAIMKLLTEDPGILLDNIHSECFDKLE